MHSVWNITSKLGYLLLILLLLIGFNQPALALDARDNRLLWVGAEFFPRITHAILLNKPADARLMLIYSDQANKQQAERIAQSLNQKLNLPYQLHSGLAPLLFESDSRYYYFVFITDPAIITPELMRALDQPNTMTFAPFNRSVEQGIDVGLHIQAIIRPKINVAQLAKKTWSFRPFFSDIAEHYSPSD
jgi:hypothetical protein